MAFVFLRETAQGLKVLWQTEGGEVVEYVSDMGESSNVIRGPLSGKMSMQWYFCLTFASGFARCIKLASRKGLLIVHEYT